MEPNQLDLFSDPQIRATAVGGPDKLLMDYNVLVQWKSDIAKHQQRARDSKSAFQVTLFDLAPAQNDPDAIDPFSLTLQSMAFWRFPVDSKGSACIYFIIDSAAELLLYIGETCRSNLRWKGEHDCKRYIGNYQDLHYRHGLKTAVNMAFWWDAPVQARPRQQLELSLILRWRSPFNKQNWAMWQTPFTGGR